MTSVISDRRVRFFSVQSLLATFLALLGLLGLASGWQVLPPSLLLLGLLWLPGAVLWRTAEALWGPSQALGRGPGRIAAETTVGLLLFVPAIGPSFLAAGGIGGATTNLGLFYAVIGVAALTASIVRCKRQPSAAIAVGGSGADWWAAGVAVAILLPLVLGHAGGTVDDWWDTAFVGAWSQGQALDFAEPFMGTGLSHPRFMWNAWLLLQALVVHGSGISAHSLQSGSLAALVCLLSVSAQAGFARALFGNAMPVARLATIVAVPCWLLATEAIPYFTRLHQDKFVAILVFVPVMLSAALACLGNADNELKKRALNLLLLFAAAAAVCSVHSLVYCIGLLGVIVAVAGVLGRQAVGSRVRLAGAVLIAAGAPLLYPLGQVWALSSRLHAQGISLATPDNPVVRAHLWLGRLVGSEGLFYVVDPRAVFGPFVLLAAVGLVVAALGPRRERRESRLLLGLTLVPLALVCVPGLAAVMGKLMLPWMIYRLLWLVPVAALAGLALEWAFGLRPWQRSGAAVAVLTALAVLTVVPTTISRYARGMHAEGRERPRHPGGSTLEVLDFLASVPGSGPVLAPAGLSEVIPALAGRTVVAMSERATLVFSKAEAEAYRRMYDRARFFSSWSEPFERAQVVARYGVRQAVFRNRWVTEGSEVSLMSRFAMEGTLLSADEHNWSNDTGRLLAALPEGSRVLFRNVDFVVVELPTSRGDQPVRASAAVAGDWTSALGVGLSKPVVSAASLEPLASTAGWPGAEVRLAPVPLSLGTSSKHIWMRGLGSWDDGATESSITLDFGRNCRADQLELVPFMRKRRRQLLELETGGRRQRFQAFDGVPLRMPLDGTAVGSLTVRVRSLLGTPIGFSEVRVLGELGACSSWQAWGEPRDGAERLGLGFLIETSSAYPNSARASLALARRLADGERVAGAEAILRFALSRDPKLANAWVELGLMRDLRGSHGEALAAYRHAVGLDSQNAWARGCLAWARLRDGRTVSALYHVGRAHRLDPRYADAHTILARIKRSFGLHASARSSLRRAIEMDRRRNWAYMELASLLAEDGETIAALGVLDELLRIEPNDGPVGEMRASMLASLPSN